MTTYILETRNGELVRFETELTVERAREQVLAHREEATGFARSLAGARNPSRKQELWLLYAAQQMIAPPPQRQGPMLPLVDCMARMQDKALKRVVLRFPSLGNGEVRLAFCTHSRNKGGIYISAGGEYYGRVEADGTPVLAPDAPEGLLELLERVNEDPLAAAQDYGRETGTCSVCGRTLTDPLSIQAGIGPVCAGRMA